MQKEAAVDPRTIARFGLGGALVGGSTAAIISLLHAVNLARRRRKELQQPSETDENTIVITLPTGKTAEVKCSNGEPVSLRHVNRPETSSKPLTAIKTSDVRAPYYPSQPMKVGMTFEDWQQEKMAAWQNLTAAVLATTGGGLIGYQIINRAYQKALERRLKAEELAAKQEMLDAMSNQDFKLASPWLERLFDAKLTKDAGQKISYLDVPMAVTALLLLLGTGSTAYVTKKMVDAKLKPQEREFKPPQLRRIMFKSQPVVEPDEEPVTPDELDSIKTAIMLSVDALSPDGTALNTPEVKAAMEKCGCTVDELHKLALFGGPGGSATADMGNTLSNIGNQAKGLFYEGKEKIMDILPNKKPPMLGPGGRMITPEMTAPIIDFLKTQPELRRRIQQSVMSQHPILKYLSGLVGLPGFSQLADQIMYSRVSRMEPSDFYKMLPTVSRGIMPPKQGSNVLGPSFMANMLTEGVKDVMPEDEASSEASTTEESAPQSIEEILAKIQLSSSDPAAAAYLEANKDKIRAMLTRMAAGGQLGAVKSAARIASSLRGMGRVVK